MIGRNQEGMRFDSPEDGLCGTRNAIVRDVAQVVAHELGHMYTHRRLGTQRYARTSQQRLEDIAMSWENYWSRTQKPWPQAQRCRY